MRTKASVLLGLLAVAASVTIDGCSSGSSNAANGQVTLNVIGWKGGGGETSNVPEINAAFEKAYPNIKINYSYVTSTEYTTKLNAEFLAGKAPDVVMANTWTLPTWAKNGYVQDLSGQSWAGELSAPVKPLAEVGGKVYAEPNELSGLGLFSNMSILNSVGITTAPTTWSQFTVDLQTLKAAGKPGLELPDQAGWTIFEAINAQAAYQVYQGDPGWDQQQAAGSATFSGTAGWSAAMQQIAALGTGGLIDYQDQLGINEWSTTDYQAGKAAFTLQGSWQNSAFVQAVPQTQFSPWPGAASGGQQIASTAVGTMWSINAATSHQQAAEDYLDFWATSQALDPYLTAEIAYSPFTNVATPNLTDAKSFATAMSSGKFIVMPENGWAGGASQTALGNDVQALVLGKATVAQTLSAYDSEDHKTGF